MSGVILYLIFNFFKLYLLYHFTNTTQIMKTKSFSSFLHLLNATPSPENTVSPSISIYLNLTRWGPAQIILYLGIFLTCITTKTYDLMLCILVLNDTLKLSLWLYFDKIRTERLNTFLNVNNIIGRLPIIVLRSR